MDYFSLLGLPRSLVVDADLLQANYYQRARRHHPDRHPANDAAATSETAALNRAYRTLRDPVARAGYWLELEGEHLRDNDNRVPPRIAAICFETHELMKQARSGADPTLVQRLQDQHAALTAKRATLNTSLDLNFARWNEDACDRGELRGELRTLLLELTYLQKLTDDVEATLKPAA